MTEEKTNALDAIRELGWQIISAEPAGFEIATRDRVGAPQTYRATDGYFSAERVTDHGQRLTESSHSPEQLLDAIRARDAHVQRIAGGPKPHLIPRRNPNAD